MLHTLTAKHKKKERTENLLKLDGNSRSKGLQHRSIHQIQQPNPTRNPCTKPPHPRRLPSTLPLYNLRPILRPRKCPDSPTKHGIVHNTRLYIFVHPTRQQSPSLHITLFFHSPIDSLYQLHKENTYAFCSTKNVMNPNVQVPPPVHQTQGDPDVYPPAYPSGGSFHSYDEAISFVEMYSPKTTITESKQLPSIPTVLQVWNLLTIDPFCFLVQAKCTHTIFIS